MLDSMRLGRDANICKTQTSYSKQITAILVSVTGARLPHLGRALTVPPKPEYIFARLQVFRHYQLVVEGDVSEPLARALSLSEKIVGWYCRIVARRLEPVLAAAESDSVHYHVSGRGHHLPGRSYR